MTGITVLDLSHAVAGAYCTMLMADAGAKVVRVKPAGGRFSRTGDVRKGVGLDATELALGRGKETVELELPAGLQQLQRLGAAADVIVDDFSPTGLEKIGLSYDKLRRRDPRLITTSISLWGSDQKDGRQDRDDAAVVAEAASTLQNRSHVDPDVAPRPYGFPLGEMATGLTAYAAVVSALLARSRMGHGRHLPISMVHSLLALNPITVTGAQIPVPGGIDRVAGYGIFRCADGHVILGVNTDKLWARLCECMGRPDLAVHPRFARYQERDQRVDEANALVTEWLMGHTAAEVVDIVGPSGVPVGQVSTAEQVLGSEVLHRLGYLWRVEDGRGGSIEVPGNPFGFELIEHRMAIRPEGG